MIKARKKLVPILSFMAGLVALLGGFSLQGVKASAAAEETAIKQVTLQNFEYFNIYSEDSQNITMGMAKYGMLLRFDDVLSDDRSEINGGIKALNLVEQYGKNIYVNDMPLTFYKGAEVCYYFEEYMWIYIPNLDIYRKISVDESFQFEDRMIQPFALYSMYNDYGFSVWTDSADGFLATKTQEVEFKGIMFNNTGYKYFSPKNGLLLEFDIKNDKGEWLNKNLSNTITEKDGGWMEYNLLEWNEALGENEQHGSIKNTFLGAGASVGENIFLDGIPFKDIPGAEISYHSERFLWLYTPNMIDYSKIEINDGTLFLDSYLPAVTLYSNGNAWVEYDPNASRANTTGVESVSYAGIEWNNADYDYRGGKNGVLIRFSKNLSKIQSEIEGGIRVINKLNTAIGNHVKLNGTPLAMISGAEISYHSEQFLWVSLPSDALTLDGGFPCLTIDANTEFLNAELPELALYFDGSYWQEELPNADDFSKTQFADIMHNNVTIDGNEGYAYTVLTFADDFTCVASSRPNLAQTGDAGQKIIINGKSLNELYQEDVNVRCTFIEAYGNNTLQLIVRKADLCPTAEYPITTLTVVDGMKAMDKALEGFTLYLVDGKWSQTSAPSAPAGEDRKAPHLYYYGEDEYQVLVGEESINYAANALAFDEIDGKLACKVVFPDGALTNGKWNRGTWQVKLVATDAKGNQTERVILVTAILAEEQYLSIYVNGIFSYRARYGEKIRMDKSEELNRGNPEKVDSATSYFVFTGWTFKGEKWDFENDIVTEDVYLSPTFKEYKRLYTLTIQDDNGILDTLTVKYGDIIELSDYKKEGYTLLAEIDDTSINRVTVNGDLIVKLHYKPVGRESNLVSGILILLGCWAGTALLAVAGVILYKKSKEKAGKKQ